MAKEYDGPCGACASIEFSGVSIHAHTCGIVSKVEIRGGRSCNRHVDCDEADRIFRDSHPNGKYVGNGVIRTTVDHCDDDSCEECFGY